MMTALDMDRHGSFACSSPPFLTTMRKGLRDTHVHEQQARILQDGSGYSHLQSVKQVLHCTDTPRQQRGEYVLSSKAELSWKLRTHQ